MYSHHQEGARDSFHLAIAHCITYPNKSHKVRNEKSALINEIEIYRPILEKEVLIKSSFCELSTLTIIR